MDMPNPSLKAAIDEPAPDPARKRSLFAAWTVLALVVCGLAISRQSFWIDEACTAVKAGQPTLAGWWHEMVAMSGSDLQMPFYMVFAWGWEKLVGLNEFVLRAGNAPWFLLGLTVMLCAVAAAPRFQKCLALVALSSPLAWQYLNEARPYAMQIGMGLAVFFSLYQLGRGQQEPQRERYWIITLCLASLVLAASSMLAMLWLGAYWGAAVLSALKEDFWRLAREYRLYWGLTLMLLFALGLYYLWTLKTGASASLLEATGFRNVLWIAYELLGFSGLGPGRLAVRTGGVHAFLPWIPWLAIYAVLLLPVLAQGWRQITASTPKRTLLCWVIAFAAVGAFILAVGVVTQFRVLGRHFLPALPLLLFVLGTGVAALLNRRSLAAQGVVVGFLGLSLLSSLNLRFSERHAKDDYRDAAALGREALACGESVWWSACSEGAEVYHLPATKTPGKTNLALIVINPSAPFLQTLPRPDLVLVSKPDLYDGSRALENYLVRCGFQRTASLNAFTVWRTPGKSNAPPPPVQAKH